MNLDPLPHSRARRSQPRGRPPVAVHPAERERHVAAAVFRSLPGVWHYHRTLTSARPSAPHGEANGTATFSPDDVPGQLRYVERGTFLDLSQGGRRHAVTQRYLYQVDDAAHRIVVRRQNDGLADTLLHALSFPGPSAAPSAGTRNATADLSCGSDHYASHYGFDFARQDVATFRVVHRVTGPTKDYISATTYTR